MGNEEQPGTTNTKWMVESERRCGVYLERLRADPGLVVGCVARHYIDELDRLHGALFDTLNRQRCEIDGLLSALESDETPRVEAIASLLQKERRICAVICAKVAGGYAKAGLDTGSPFSAIKAIEAALECEEKIRERDTE